MINVIIISIFSIYFTLRLLSDVNKRKCRKELDEHYFNLKSWA
jgi:hypothetical protein